MTGRDEPAEQNLRMSPEEEQQVLREREELPVQPADEGIGAHSDADGDDHTEN
jgi:hypothetical protein